MPRFGWRYFASKPADWWNPPEPGPFEKAQLDSIRQLIEGRAPKSILEIGVGRGRATGWFRGEWSYVGVEVNAKLLEDARLRDGGPFLVGTGTHLPVKDGRFEAVVAFDVFMHIWDRHAFLQECRRVLSPNGSLVINYLRRFSRGWRSYVLSHVVHPATTWKARDRRFDSQGDMRKLLLSAKFSPEFFMVDTSVPFLIGRRT